MPNIHPTAVVDPGAKLADDVTVGPLSTIGGEVELGPGVEIAVPGVRHRAERRLEPARASIPFAVLGLTPQVLGFDGRTGTLEIGEGNEIREYVSIHVGLPDHGGITSLGRPQPDPERLPHRPTTAGSGTTCVLGRDERLQRPHRRRGFRGGGGHVRRPPVRSHRRVGVHGRQLDGQQGRAALLEGRRRPSPLRRGQHHQPRAARVRQGSHRDDQARLPRPLPVEAALRRGRHPGRRRNATARPTWPTCSSSCARPSAASSASDDVL